MRIKTGESQSLFPGGVDTQFVSRRIKTGESEPLFPDGVDSQSVSERLKTGHRASIFAGRVGFSRKTGVNW
jgi:hypothetical protein